MAPNPGMRRLWLTLLAGGWLVGCAPRHDPAASAPTTQPVLYDTTLPKPVEPRDRFERAALERGPDLGFVDWLMDERTKVPGYDRPPPPRIPAGAEIASGLPVLSDENPFPDREPLPPKEVTIRVGVGRSTFRTRTREEVLSAVQPFIDLVQREVNVRGAPLLYEDPGEIYYGLIDGQAQMVACHVFDYLLVRSWVSRDPDNATVLLATARPARPRTGELDRDFTGTAGASIELVVAADSELNSFADLRGKRLTLAANYTRAPGAFLTRLLQDAGHPAESAYFGSVTLRRYSKDAVLDVIKGKADVACIDQGTIGALDAFYGLGQKLRVLAVSPRYNVDVMFTTLNNVATHRTEVELTQTQLTTLGKDPEGQEVLFFFDTEGWSNYREGDIDIPREHFADFVAFIEKTPVDLKPLLDPKAPVDARTYDRFGDE